jgi:hypothetical protein
MLDVSAVQAPWLKPGCMKGAGDQILEFRLRPIKLLGEHHNLYPRDRRAETVAKQADYVLIKRCPVSRTFQYVLMPV